MTEIKHLNPCAVGTITTGIVLVHAFEGVGEAFEWVMGHPVWTHEMPMLGSRAKALILEQHPDFPADPPVDWQALMARLWADWPNGIPIARGPVAVAITAPLSGAPPCASSTAACPPLRSK